MKKIWAQSLAHEILQEEMYRPYLLGTESNEPQDMTTSSKPADNADSGMEDECSSPLSVAASEVNVTSDSDSESIGHENSDRPKSLTLSETSAFNRIERPSTAEPHPFSQGALPLLYQSAGGSYFPGAPISPWVPAEFFQRGASFPTPRMFPAMGMYPGVLTDTSDRRDGNKLVDNIYSQVDPNIPFTKYFMNLTKLFQKESNSLHSPNRSEESGKSASIVQKPAEKDNEESRSSSVCEKDGVERISSPEASPSGSALSSVQGTRHPVCMPMNPLFSASSSTLPLSGVHMDSLASFSSFSQTNPLFLMGGMTSPPAGMIHPAFLQMAGLGSKRINPEKPPPVKKYKCDVCGKAFSRSNTLVTHKRIHTGDKPFKCEICGRAFRQPGNLTRHRLTHTTVKPYVCPTCNKAFNRASNLHTHMRTHTNYRPFICPYCGKGFHQKIDMKIHCFTHTGERPHRCDICGKGFTLASTLNTHRRIHDDSAATMATHQESMVTS